MHTNTVTPDSRALQIRRAGAWCAAGGLLGIVEGIVTLSWPHQSTGEWFRYPHSEFWFVIFELAYAFQHVLLIAGGIALLWLPAVRASRTALIAARVAVAGLALLVVTELSAIALYDQRIDSPLATAIATSFMLPTLLIGGGFTVAGIALMRQRRDRAGARWLPVAVLAPGAYTFLVFIPLITTAADFVARLGISGWMLLFAVLGYALTRFDK
ncbi:MAG: hypothetical protein ACRDWY_09410 [Actinomycetes bacterium]